MRNNWLAALAWSKRQWVFGLVALFIFIIPLVVAYSLGLDINKALLLSTGLVLLVYTIETYGMRLEMVRQNEIAIEPLVIARIERKGEQRVALTERGHMILKNVGQGPALFVRIRDTFLTDVAVDRVRFVAKFNTVDCLEPGKDATVTANCEAINAKVRPEHLDFFPSLDPSTAIENYDVTIEYQDTSGQLLSTIVQMGKGEIRLLRHGKVHS